MPLKKIHEFPQPCIHPEHDPPMHIVLEEGVYEYTCPGCGAKQIFTVRRPRSQVWKGGKAPRVEWAGQ
jgi:predicted RNA-binding Zn-ribbon protein involved in translation (DUF1610 family)